MCTRYSIIARIMVLVLCCGFVACSDGQSSKMKNNTDTIDTDTVNAAGHFERTSVLIERGFNMFFLGHYIDCSSDSVYFAFNEAFAKDKNVSFNMKTGDITICGTTFHVNEDGTILMSSVQPESKAMKKVVTYLNNFYGEAYEQSPEDYIWPAFRDSTMDEKRYPNIHLRRIRGEEGGTAIIFD